MAKLIKKGTLLKYKGYISVTPTTEQFNTLSDKELKNLSDKDKITTIKTQDGREYNGIKFKINTKNFDTGEYLNSPNINSLNPDYVLENTKKYVEVVVEADTYEYKKKKGNRFILKNIKSLIDYSNISEGEYEVINPTAPEVADEELPFE